MRRKITLLTALCALQPAVLTADDFLSHPELLKADPRLGGAQTYFHADALARLPGFDQVMVDEPVIFLAPDSPYDGIKASDLAALSDEMRSAFAKGLAEEPTSFGNYTVVDGPGAGVLYLRMALKDVYVRKNKRGLFSYTPVGAVTKGVTDMNKEVFDKTTMVEMSLEAELQDSQSGEVLFAGILEAGHRKDKKAHIDEEAVEWEATGAVAEVMGRRVACRLDNARRPENQRRDCIAELPLPFAQ